MAELRKLYVTVLVYGPRYVADFIKIVLPNLAGLLNEIPEPLRSATCFRILTDQPGEQTLISNELMVAISRDVTVRITGDILIKGYQEFGPYGPMIHGQSRMVEEASREGAGIIFCPPDLVWSKGSFAAIIKRTQEGYRAIIGPSARGIEEEISPILIDRIAAHPNKWLEISSTDLTALLLDHWQQINEGFIWNGSSSNKWKAYSYYRVGPRQYLMRYYQGPSMFLWPKHAVHNYSGWIDHRLIRQCVDKTSEIYVVSDAKELQTVDLASRDRVENLEKITGNSWWLFWEFLDRKHLCRFNILYSGHSTRVYDTDLPEGEWESAERLFHRAHIVPVYAAIALRPIMSVLSSLWRHLGGYWLYALARGIWRRIRHAGWVMLKKIYLFPPVFILVAPPYRIGRAIFRIVTGRAEKAARRKEHW